jgi:ribosome-associated protein
MKEDKILQAAKRGLEAKLAEDIEVIDVSNLTPLAEYYLLATASNPRKMKAIQEEVEKQIMDSNGKIHHVEGIPQSGWVLIDAYHIIIHIFTPDERERINFSDLLSRRRD